MFDSPPFNLSDVLIADTSSKECTSARFNKPAALSKMKTQFESQFSDKLMEY